jgi:hypothetical protein
MRKSNMAPRLSPSPPIWGRGEIEPARQKALTLSHRPQHLHRGSAGGVRHDFAFSMFRANAVYEACIFGTSIARPLIAKKQIDRREAGADAVSRRHRRQRPQALRLAITALKPDINDRAPGGNGSDQPRGCRNCR